MTPPRGAGAGNEAAEPQLIHIPQQQPAQRHNQATENYRSQMAKFFQNSEQESTLFDNSRIHGGRQYSEHPYEGTLLRGLDELRKNGILCDIKLIVENKEFDAHKSVLASCSTYFRVMFTTSMIEKEKELGENLIFF